MKSKTIRPMLVAISVLILAAMACQFSLPDPSAFLDRISNQISFATPQPVTDTPIQVSSDLVSQQDALVSLYRTVSPGVVSIATSSDQGGALGSGFVVDSVGHIVTNYHVVEGANYIEVSFPSGFKAVADVVGVDTDSDLAVIHVDAPASELVPLTLGDSDALQVGQYVVAIGNPFGLNGSMSIGIISSLGRTLDSMNAAPDSSGQFFSAGDIIQTDAAINPGNSGGPLLDLQGEVVGVNRAIRSLNTDQQGNALNSGIGFAVSVNIVKRVVPAIIENGHYDYPYLGLSSAQDLSLAQAQQLGLDSTNGALVENVVAGGPADDAGLVAGDMIVGIDGRTMKNFDEMLSYLFTHKSPGDVVQLQVLRNGQQIEVDVTLGARPKSN
jgi:2-alkenal reductase